MKKTYRAFSAGEVSEDMYSRYDVDKYGSGCMRLVNFIIMAQGGVFKAPGRQFVAEVKDSTRFTIMIPFEFSTIQAYDLEFGHLYMRVVKDGAQVLNAAQNITGITQANPGVFTVNAHGYTNGQEVYISGVGGMIEMNGRNAKIAGATTNTFTLTDLGGTPINTTSYTAYTSGGTVASVYEIVTPFTETEIADIYFGQTADVMTLVHENHDPYELTRTGHTAWTLTQIPFAPGIARPTGLTAAVGVGSGSTTYKYKVTAVLDETYEESLVGLQATKNIGGITQANPAVVTVTSHGYTSGDEVYINSVGGMTNLNDNQYKITVLTANTFSLDGVNSTGYPAYTSGGTVARTDAQVNNNLSTAGNSNNISWTAVTGAIKYNIYKNDSGTYGYIGSSESTSFKDDNIEPAVGNTPPRARNPFIGTGNKPSVVAFQQQRRAFAASLNKPDTIWMSRAGQYRNMSTSVPNKDDDAITFAIASGQVNKINHLVSFRDLLAMTVAQEYKIGAGGGAYTPTTMQAQPETNYGSQGDNVSKRVKPIMIGNTCIMATKYGRSVRDYAFTFEADGYDGNDLSILSKHLLENAYITSWAFAQEPNKIIWATLSDGTMVSLTYMREHRVWGWARHDVDGDVEWVTSIPDPARRMDSVYFIVKRVVNGRNVRYIERLEKYIDAPIEDAFFLDCGLSYKGSPITVVRNLWHLEGRAVTAYADGSVYGPFTVAQGQITLEREASTVHVGLPYKSELWPLATEMDLPQGSTKGNPKAIRTVQAEVIRTRGLKIGQSPTDTTFGRMRPVFEDNDMAGIIQPYTGLTEPEGVQMSWDQNYVAPYVFHEDPVPCKIISLTPDYAE